MDKSPASDRLPARVTIGTLTLVLFCLGSSVRMVKDAPAPGHLNASDLAKRSDQRFSALRAALPQRGVVGYVGEPGIPALADYYLAEYALAPLVVDHSASHVLVVGNFPASLPASMPPEGLQLVKDFGNGVLLLASKDNK